MQLYYGGGGVCVYASSREGAASCHITNIITYYLVYRLLLVITNPDITLHRNVNDKNNFRKFERFNRLVYVTGCFFPEKNTEKHMHVVDTYKSLLYSYPVCMSYTGTSMKIQ